MTGTRLEDTIAGRAIISGFIVFVIAIVVVSNLPAGSSTYQTLYSKAEPTLQATGLQQTWHLFAPNPRMQTKWLEADLTYADGTVVRWHQPRGDALIGTYRGFRWQKWASNLMRDQNRELWEPAARWVARTNERDGREPIQVALVRRIKRFQGLGVDRPAPWTEEAFFVLNLGDARTENGR